MKRLAYLESTGTQYIDTGILTQDGLTMDVDLSVVQVEGSYYGNHYSLSCDVGGDNQSRLYYVRAGYVAYTTGLTPYKKYNIRTTFNEGSQTLAVDGVTQITSTYSLTGTGYNVYIFKRNSSTDNGSYIRIYKFKIYVNDVLTRDYIPVLDGNGVACLFDKVTNTFYYNQGTGTFVAGTLKQLEYIESTGHQYIDTGFKHNQDTRMVADIDFNPSGRYQTPFGSWGNDRNNRTALFGSETPDNNLTTTTCYYGNIQSWSVSSSVWKKRTIWDLNKNVYTIGTSTKTFTAKTFQSIYNDYIFGKTGYAGTIEGRTKMKLYSFKIYDNDVLIRDYVPVLINGETPCLWDLVEDKFYFNQGDPNYDFQYDNLDLIYDRTQADVTYAKNNQSDLKLLKGAYNYIDLNRVEKWCEKLKNTLNEAGYSISFTTKTDWQRADMPTDANLERIRQNILMLMRGYHYITKIYTASNKTTYLRANNYEKILSEIYGMVTGMQGMYVYGGVAYGGEPLLIQNNFMLPEVTEQEYTPVAYIGGTGTQYLDTGFKATPKTKITIDILFTSIVKQDGIFGTRRTNNLYYISYINDSPRLTMSYTENSHYAQASSVNPSANTRYLVECDGVAKKYNVTIPNGTVYTFNLSKSPTKSAVDNLLLMAYTNANSGAPMAFAHMRIYSCKIYDNGTLIRDYIPVLDKNDVPCLYDKVTKTFFYNKGTGTFNYGWN